MLDWIKSFFRHSVDDIVKPLSKMEKKLAKAGSDALKDAEGHAKAVEASLASKAKAEAEAVKANKIYQKISDLFN